MKFQSYRSSVSFLLLGLLSLTNLVAITNAQIVQEEPIEQVEVKPEEIVAEPFLERINAIIPSFQLPEAVPVGDLFSLDATSTELMTANDASANFSWDLGDGSVLSWGQQITHIYDVPGVYTVRLNVKQGSERETLEKKVVVYVRSGVLITNRAESAIADQAAEAGLYLKKILYKEAETGFATEETLAQLFQESYDLIRQADVVLVQTNDSFALQTLSQWWQRLSAERQFPVTDKTWIQLTNGPIHPLAQQTLSPFRALGPKSILLTRPEALTPILTAETYPELISLLETRSIEYSLVDERTGGARWLPLSRAMTFFVTNGISQNVIYLLLAVPFMAFLVAFFRHFVGIKTYGVYTPMMLGLSFLVLGLQFGLVAFMTVLLVSTLIRWIFSNVELLYIPKVSLTLSVLALSFFLVLGLGIYIDTSVNLSLTIFPMLVMVTVSEKFLSNQSSSGMRNALINTAETVFVGLVGYFFLTWVPVKEMILSRPEWVLLPLLGSYWLGKFTGLRLSEYIKFNTFFRDYSDGEE